MNGEYWMDLQGLPTIWENTALALSKAAKKRKFQEGIVDGSNQGTRGGDSRILCLDIFPQVGRVFISQGARRLKPSQGKNLMPVPDGLFTACYTHILHML